MSARDGSSVSPLLPVFIDRFVRSFPKHVRGGRALYLPMGDAFGGRFNTDAHFAAYSEPAIARRLSGDVLHQRPVRMVLAVFDVDCPETHGTNDPVSDSWWRTEAAKIERLYAEQPGLLVYRTRGGLRIVGRLDPVVVLRGPEDSEQWTRRYGAWCNYLKRRFGIACDLSCGDWTRLFRLPRVVRDGHAEEREVIGEPTSMGAWRYLARAEDFPEPKASVVAGLAFPPVNEPVISNRGALFYAFRARGWLGEEVRPGVWVARCPFDDAHTTGAVFDGSTVLYEAWTAQKPGRSLGRLHCLHAHCRGRDFREVMALFSASEMRGAA